MSGLKTGSWAFQMSHDAIGSVLVGVEPEEVATTEACIFNCIWGGKEAYLTVLRIYFWFCIEGTLLVELWEGIWGARNQIWFDSEQGKHPICRSMDLDSCCSEWAEPVPTVTGGLFLLFSSSCREAPAQFQEATHICSDRENPL